MSVRVHPQRDGKKTYKVRQENIGTASLSNPAETLWNAYGKPMETQSQPSGNLVKTRWSPWKPMETLLTFGPWIWTIHGRFTSPVPPPASPAVLWTGARCRGTTKPPQSAPVRLKELLVFGQFFGSPILTWPIPIWLLWKAPTSDIWAKRMYNIIIIYIYIPLDRHVLIFKKHDMKWVSFCMFEVWNLHHKSRPPANHTTEFHLFPKTKLWCRKNATGLGVFGRKIPGDPEDADVSRSDTWIGFPQRLIC